MKISKDLAIVKNLAGKYSEISNRDDNLKKLLLHKGVNDLKMERPIVLIDEAPWNELADEPDLILQCENEKMRGIEGYFRRELYKYNHFPADRIFLPYYPIQKAVNSTGIGVEADETTLGGDSGGIMAHAYNDLLETEEDIEKLKIPEISYDKEKTDSNFYFISEVINNIMPVKIVGLEAGYSTGHKIWDTVSVLKGVTNLLIDLAERPEFMHRLAEKLTIITIETLKQYEKLGLLDHAPLYIHSTAGATNDLTPPDDYENVKLSNTWGRGLAQIFASVSPAMHDEFDIQYAKRVLEPFGLSYYGCCEPLDKKIDILRQIKNLRKISITPWADINVAAEAIGKDYVVSVKPNPSALSPKNLDKAAVKKELSDLCNACYKNGCSFELVLKDISSTGGNPLNLTEWEQIAMSIVK